MIFKIKRVSGWRDTTAPCEGAYRSADDRDWLIEVSTLEALIELSRAVDESLIFDPDSITIYDDYVE